MAPAALGVDSRGGDVEELQRDERVAAAAALALALAAAAVAGAAPAGAGEVLGAQDELDRLFSFFFDFCISFEVGAKVV